LHQPSWLAHGEPPSAEPLDLIGLDDDRRAELAALGDPDLQPARVARVDRGLVHVLTADGARRLPWPPVPVAVGDWLAVGPDDAVRPLARRSALVRRGGDQTRSSSAYGQVLAANVDVVAALRALDSSISLTRIQALVTLAWDSGAAPLVVLSKTDLADAPAAVAAVERVAVGVRVLAVSAVTGEGLEDLRDAFRGRTGVFLGESGAGKSTLTNLLAGQEVLATGAVRADGEGRHTTTYRQLVPLPGGGAVIDTPGVREAGYFGSAEGLARAFADVDELAAACRFGDCSHDGEPGCAVRAALRAGELAYERVDAYRKALREQAFAERKADRALRSAERQRWRRMEKARRRDAW
jgi:ribosome biogenesis GTPase